MPVLVEQSFFVLMGIVNTMMAGWIGPTAGAATGAVDSLNFIFVNFVSSLAVGVTVVVAQFVGQGNRRAAEAAVGQALVAEGALATLLALVVWLFRHPILVLLFGRVEPDVMEAMDVYLSVTLIGYPLIAMMQVVWGALRGAGDTKTPMTVNVVMNVLNALFGYVLIFGVAFPNGPVPIVIGGRGVMGAALGITLARGVGTLIALWIIARGAAGMRLGSLRGFRFERELLVPLFRIGFPAGSESLMFNCGKIITQVFIAGMGTAAMAANTFAGAIVTYMNLPGMALQTTAVTMIGQAMGRGDVEEAAGLFRHILFLGTFGLTALGWVAIPFAADLARLFTNDAEIVSLAALLIRLNGLFMVMWCASFVLPSALKGAGDAKFTMWATIAGMWLFRVVLGFALGIALNWGVVGIWVSMFVDWAVRGVLFQRRVVGRRWRFNRVTEMPADPGAGST